MSILQIFYLLILVSTISFGTVRLRSLTFPLKIVYAICVISFLNEIIVHYLLKEIKLVFMTYHVYNYLAFLFYYLFFCYSIKVKSSRIIIILISVFLFILCIYTEKDTLFTTFPSFSLAAHSIGLVISSLIFISYRLNNPSEIPLNRDSHFLVVMMILVYWAVFISKHALQSEIIRQGHKLDFIEALFTIFCMCYYCGLGIVFYRHRANESRSTV
jgi:hypothetical protein